MMKRVITAVLIICCVIPPLYFGGWLLDILVGIIVILGGMELLKLMPNYKRIHPLCCLAYQAVCFAAILLPNRFQFGIMGLAILISLAIPIFTARLTSRDSFVMATTFVLFFVFAKAFYTIYEADVLYAIFVIVATYACDTGAYLIGIKFGKHKLIERISPHKTIEGAIGGLVFSLALSLGFAYCFMQALPQRLILVSALVLSLTSQIGDLTFSAIKRTYGIKDFSQLFPGHGGMMDRLDSLVFNLVVFYFIFLLLG